ncbi:MAG: AAA family ATPase [Bacteroidetes bacterium]|nr:AAA family ATPase [Bacteroidota bacterium]
MNKQFTNDAEGVKALAEHYGAFKKEIARVIVGQDEIVSQLSLALFGGGHCLLVGVPGLAKTLLIQTVSRALGLQFQRIQFTPDLMPSDITGSEILNDNRKFEFQPGPLFANIVLADEINRTPPKTQAALLEAMQEKAVTVSGKRYPLSAPFFVLATQNPIEQEGTYPLPEAQLDRFMFQLELGYPSFEEEIQIVRQTTMDFSPELKTIMDATLILAFQSLVRRIPVTDHVLEYAVGVVAKTRPLEPKADSLAKEYLSWGAGPRASQNLILGAKAHAAMHGRFTPDIQDVQAIAPAVLRHRIVRNYKAEAEGIFETDIIRKLL